MPKETWIVEVGHEDADPTVYGPYTPAQAERVAKKVQEEIALGTTPTGQTFHPNDAINAVAMPLRRYVFLTSAERNQLRRAVRAEAVYAGED